MLQLKTGIDILKVGIIRQEIPPIEVEHLQGLLMLWLINGINYRIILPPYFQSSRNLFNNKANYL